MLVKVICEHFPRPQLTWQLEAGRGSLTLHHEVSTKLDWKHNLNTENDRIWMLHNKHVYHSIKEQNSNWRQHSAFRTHIGLQRTGEGPLNPHALTHYSTTLGSAGHSHAREKDASTVPFAGVAFHFRLNQVGK